MAEETTSQPQESGAAPRGGSDTSGIYLVSYPKIVFLYPTLIAALIAGIYMGIAYGFKGTGDTAPPPAAAEVVPEGAEAPAPRTDRGAAIVGWVFLLILTTNLFVFAFDFPRATSLTLVFFCAAIVLSGILIFQFRPDWLPFMGDILRAIRPVANATFYLFIAGVLTVIFAGVLLSVKLDYWEVRSNELLHHHGVLSDLERFSAPNLRVDKEINDIFEYLLLGSGRLILHPSNERRAIVLDNVMFINSKEKRLSEMLGSLHVRVREQP